MLESNSIKISQQTRNTYHTAHPSPLLFATYQIKIYQKKKHITLSLTFEATLLALALHTVAELRV
jgi:hypothetical protein